MHPRLEQCYELNKVGKSIHDLDAVYRVTQQSSKVTKAEETKPDYKPPLKPDFHPARTSPRKPKPPIHPETLRRALQKDKAAEDARRNAPRSLGPVGAPEFNDTGITRLLTSV